MTAACWWWAGSPAACSRRRPSCGSPRAAPASSRPASRWGPEKIRHRWSVSLYRHAFLAINTGACMSVDKAIRDMIRDEVEAAVAPLTQAIAQIQDQGGVLAQLQALLGGKRRGPG